MLTILESGKNKIMNFEIENGIIVGVINFTPNYPKGSGRKIVSIGSMTVEKAYTHIGMDSKSITDNTLYDSELIRINPVFVETSINIFKKIDNVQRKINFDESMGFATTEDEAAMATLKQEYTRIKNLENQA